MTNSWSVNSQNGQLADSDWAILGLVILPTDDDKKSHLQILLIPIFHQTNQWGAYSMSQLC